MSEAQRELAAVLGSARPGPRYSRPTRGAGPTKPPRGGRQQSNGSLFEALPELLHVEGALGSASVVFYAGRKRNPLGTISTREHEPLAVYECVRCGEPRLQELVDRAVGKGGERWDVLPCPCNQGAR